MKVKGVIKKGRFSKFYCEKHPVARFDIHIFKKDDKRLLQATCTYIGISCESYIEVEINE